VVCVAKSKLSAAGAMTTTFHFALSGTVAEKDADTRTLGVWIKLTRIVSAFLNKTQTCCVS
jgi:hypothetical protein